MEIFKHLIIALLDIVALTFLVHAQSQSDLGFISIDCGWLQTSRYTDKKTGIDYISDASFTDTGDSSNASNISSEYNRDTLEQPFWTVRSFPTGIKNCYTVKLTRPNVKFLIRASFMYGNYDGNSKPPRFDLLLEADVWDTIEFTNASTIVTKEILHLPQRNYVHVCLVNTYSGTPFISSLELRPLNNLIYTTQSGSLLLHLRLDVGSNSDKPIRYKDDIYDRIWTPYTRSDWKQINTSLLVNSDSEYQQPSAVMRTAVVPANGSDCLTYSSVSCCTDKAARYHVYMHFAELQEQEQVNNQPRQLYICASGRLGCDILNVPSNSYSGFVYRSADWSNLDFSINKTQSSPLPPILNAIEIYREKELSQPLTDQQDVDAIMSIKRQYKVIRSSWQGDPCSPKIHSWQGLECSYDDTNHPRITSLDLSSSGISGPIRPSISSLAKLESLDLSNNNLTGPVPNFLSLLADLRVLNLDLNKLEGAVPAELTARKEAGLLILRVEGNPGINRDKKPSPFLIAATVVPAVNLVAALSTIWILKTRNKAAAAKAVMNLASEEYTGEDDENLDGSRENGPYNTTTNEEKDNSRVSSKSKTRHFRGSNNNDRMKEKKRADAFHSGSSEPTINEEKDMNRAYSKTKRGDEICDNEGEEENICAEEYSGEDNVNLDGSREDGLDNTMPSEEKDKGCVSSKLKTRHFRGSNNKENKRVNAFQSGFGKPTINEEKDMNRAYSKTKRGDENCDNEVEEENICDKEYSGEDNINLDGSREGGPDNTTPPEEKDKGRVSSKLKTKHFRGSNNNDRMKEAKCVDAFHSGLGEPTINDSTINKEKDMNRAYSKTKRDEEICYNDDEEENICAEEY